MRHLLRILISAKDHICNMLQTYSCPVFIISFSFIFSTSLINAEAADDQLFITTIIPDDGESQACRAAMQIATDSINQISTYLPIRLDFVKEANSVKPITTGQASHVIIGANLSEQYCEHINRMIERKRNVLFNFGCQYKFADPLYWKLRFALFDFVRKTGKWNRLAIIADAENRKDVNLAKAVHDLSRGAALTITMFQPSFNVPDSAFEKLKETDSRIIFASYSNFRTLTKFLCKAFDQGFTGEKFIFIVQLYHDFDEMNSIRKNVHEDCTEEKLNVQLNSTFWIGVLARATENYGGTWLGYDLDQFDAKMSLFKRSDDWHLRHLCHDTALKALLFVLSTNDSEVFRKQPERNFPLLRSRDSSPFYSSPMILGRYSPDKREMYAIYQHKDGNSGEIPFYPVKGYHTKLSLPSNDQMNEKVTKIRRFPQNVSFAVFAIASASIVAQIICCFVVAMKYHVKGHAWQSEISSLLGCILTNISAIAISLNSYWDIINASAVCFIQIITGIVGLTLITSSLFSQISWPVLEGSRLRKRSRLSLHALPEVTIATLQNTHRSNVRRSSAFQRPLPSPTKTSNVFILVLFAAANMAIVICWLVVDAPTFRLVVEHVAIYDPVQDALIEMVTPLCYQNNLGVFIGVSVGIQVLLLMYCIIIVIDWRFQPQIHEVIQAEHYVAISSSTILGAIAVSVILISLIPRGFIFQSAVISCCLTFVSVVTTVLLIKYNLTCLVEEAILRRQRRQVRKQRRLSSQEVAQRYSLPKLDLQEQTKASETDVISEL